MPSLEFMRGVLGLLALGCVYMAARSLVAFQRGAVKISRLYGWIIRATLCLAAIAFRHPVDTVDITIWALAAVAFAAGYIQASRPPRVEAAPHIIDE
jgi:hypothetical protein